MKIVGSLFGVGFLPGAPATYASALMAGAWMLLRHFGLLPTSAGAYLWLPVAVGMLISVPAVALGTRVAREEKDPGWFVLDECAGQWIALAAAGSGNWLLGGFIVFGLFRVFDIIKPWPVRRLEALPGGWGIWADDMAAAILACAVRCALGVALPWL